MTEETAGIDLVLQQFKIANGEKLDLTEDPTPRGHAIEFRINGEDAGRGFLPAPGPVTKYDIPTGPGVRLDSGVEAGSVIGGQFDSMLSKLIVYGATREEALARSRRALDEFHVEGLATVIPFHRAVVSDPAFIGDDNGFTVHTRWIETEWDNTVEPFTGGEPIDEDEALPRQKVVVEVGGRRLEVSLPGDLALSGGGGGDRRRRDPQEAEGAQARCGRRRCGVRRRGDRADAGHRGEGGRRRGTRGFDRRPGGGPGSHEDGEPGHRAQGRRHHRTGRRDRRRHHPGHGARRDQVARTVARSRTIDAVEINAGQWYLRGLRADDRIDDRPALAELGSTDPDHVARSAAEWSADTRYSWAVCEPTTGELLAEVTLDPATGEIAEPSTRRSRRRGRRGGRIGSAIRRRNRCARTQFALNPVLDGRDRPGILRKPLRRCRRPVAGVLS